MLYSYGNSCLAKKALTEIVSHLSKDNLPVSNYLITWLMLRICQVDIGDLSTLIISIEALVLLQDSYEVERITLFLVNFLTLMKIQLIESYLPFSYMVDSFIKLILKSLTLQKKVKENINDFKFLRSWLKSNPYPIVDKVIMILLVIDFLDKDC